MIEVIKNKFAMILNELTQNTKRKIYVSSGILLSMLLAFLIFMFVAKNNNLYPFGDKSIAWCDMNQQVIPLLNSLKDILSGKNSLVYNLNFAGGMSMYAVFFFFLCSPFSLLTIFVPKENMMLFMNVLVLLKMLTGTGVMSFYLLRKYKKISMPIAIAFSILYAFSGYTMMYYQNVIWLDYLYLFPLLMISLDLLLEKNKGLMYLIMISLLVIMNYYIGAMVVFFTIFYVGLNIFYRRKEEVIGKISKKFLVYSLLAALISCFAIIPSFYEYLNSARGNSWIESIRTSWMITPYQTAIPLLLSTLLVLPFIFKSKNSIDRKVKYIILFLLMIPVLIDPINKAWHLGSYQAFPCRFAFINIFLILDLASESFNQDVEEKWHLKHLIGLIVSLGICAFAFWFESIYIEDKIDYLKQYAVSLWGNQTSFEALLRYYSIILIISVVFLVLFKSNLLHKKNIGIAMVALTIIESLFSSQIYMVVPARDDVSYREIYALENQIKDDSFYRLKLTNKLTDVNTIGAMGYKNLGHYTSLTNKDYMATMKKLGYSSYWMEVGAYGGTTFTDALLVNKYTLHYGHVADAILSKNQFSITENNVYNFGLISDNILQGNEELSLNRVENQRYLATALFNETSLIESYTYNQLKDIKDLSNDNKTVFELLNSSKNGRISYSINVQEERSLYFECFDIVSNSLSETINDSFSVFVNGVNKAYKYPSQSTNGIVYLGTFENQKVNINIELLKNISCNSFNVFSINEGKLQDSIKNSQYANITSFRDTKIEGEYSISKEGTLFLPINYTSGMKAKIDGKSIEVLKVFSNFVGVHLTEGNHKISITISQPYLLTGFLISFFGIGLFALYKFFLSKKIENIKIVETISINACLVLTIGLFIFIYITPMIINVLGQIGLI